ncbi:MAG: DsbA family protein [Candidatus Magasanikbacteria bacterium]|nr:DsbA family protein [Candidatus Magasanikbacteria bacterium]
MIKTRHLFLVFIPAIAVVSFALFVRIVQYEPVYDRNKPLDIPRQMAQLFPEDPILGNKKSPITLVAFEDFSCPACSTQSKMLDDILLQYPNSIKIIWKSISTHKSELANNYAYCANKQRKFAEFKNLAFANQNNLNIDILNIISETIELNETKLNKCLASGEAEIYNQKNRDLATILHVQAVPTFFLNDVQLQTPKSRDEWKNVLGL